MASTPSNRLKVTPSNSPFFAIPSRTPIRSRSHDPRLSLQRVVGTTCCGPAGFDTVQSSFAYVAGAAVVVVDIEGPDQYFQRFYRARPTASPVFSISPITQTASGSNTTPKANDSRNRVYGSPDWSDSPTSKTWTSRERIKAATCVSLSRDARFLAVGETGYAPRVLIFNLMDNSSNKPLVSISEHGFGVTAVAWSQDGKFLASLGSANDGFLYVWRIDTRTGAARLFQQNRCTSAVNGMFFMANNSLITYGTRHVKIWKVEDIPSSPSRRTFADTSSQPSQKALSGRNILLGSLLEENFTCSKDIDDNHALICTENGEVCILDDTSGQMRLTKSIGLDFPISCISVREMTAYVGSKVGQLAFLDVEAILKGRSEVVKNLNDASTGFLALGFTQDNLVTIDSKHSIDMWGAQDPSGNPVKGSPHILLPGLSDSVLGIQPLARSNKLGAAFYSWSGLGAVLLWGADGSIKASLDVPVDQPPSASTEGEPLNQLSVARADTRAKVFVTGDKLGVMRVIDLATKEHIMETKAHSSEITHLTIHQDESRFIIASCARDRTVQLFQRTSSGGFELCQTLEFSSRVIQIVITPDDKLITSSMDRTLAVYDLVKKEDEPEAIAAIYVRSIALKAAPVSMVMDPGSKSVFVSEVDRSIYQFDIASGRQISTFKCTDENGEAAVMDSLIFVCSVGCEPPFLLGISNTDKSVRLYDSNNGNFLDREWGHTESINGVILLDAEEKAGRKVVSAGCDGTIMVWNMDTHPSPGYITSRSPSPLKDGASATANQAPLRRVLSKAELAEFGRKSPPRTLHKRPSRRNLSSSSATKMSTSISQTSILAEETPSRKSSSGRTGSPPPMSPRTLNRRPSLPALGVTPTQPRKKSSAVNLRSSYNVSNLNAATEQTCRQLKAYRQKLSSSDPIKSDIMSELDTELRLTTAALDERANRRQQAMSDNVLNSLLDKYSDRLISMLDEKLRLRIETQSGGRKGVESPPASPYLEDEGRPQTSRSFLE